MRARAHGGAGRAAHAARAPSHTRAPPTHTRAQLEDQKYPNDFGIEKELCARVACSQVRGRVRARKRAVQNSLVRPLCALPGPNASARGSRRQLAHQPQQWPHDCLPESPVVCVQGLKLALEHTRMGLLRGELRKLDNADAYWSFMAGSKVEAAGEER